MPRPPALLPHPDRLLPPDPAVRTVALRPLLERYGTHPNLHLVLFTLDETVFCREIAPLEDFYPSVHVGAFETAIALVTQNPRKVFRL